MRGSLSRLVRTCVVVAWVLTFGVLVTYSRQQSWNEDRARRDGLFLVHGELAVLSADAREARLRELEPHFWPPLQLISRAEAAAKLERDIAPGERVHHRVEAPEQWYYFAFADEGVLAAGPFNPALPPGAVPIAAPLLIFLAPLVAGFIALRVGHELAKVERASERIAAGELGARVDNRRGPSSELAAAFNAMAERIERLVRSRDELVQAVSHELGSPLGRLRFRIALLDAPATPEEREARLAAMTRELDALDALVAELLSYVQSDELRLERRAFDARQPLADLAELASLDGPEERAVEVEFAVPDEAPADEAAAAEVFADQRLFLRAVENLLRNAVRHATSRVRLELILAGDHVCVAVHDDGPGIPEAKREAVTAPFARLSPERDRKTGGVGLGLAIVARIMDRHGGELRIETSELGGARVVTRWPRQRPA